MPKKLLRIFVNKNNCFLQNILPEIIRTSNLHSRECIISKNSEVKVQNRRKNHGLQFITLLHILPEILFIRVQNLKNRLHLMCRTNKSGPGCVRVCNICEKADMQSLCSHLI